MYALNWTLFIILFLLTKIITILKREAFAIMDVSKTQGLFVLVVVGCCNNNSSAQKEEPIYKSKQMKNVSIMMMLLKLQMLLLLLLLWTLCHVMDHSFAFFDTVTRFCCCHCQKAFRFNKLMLLLLLYCQIKIGISRDIQFRKV